MVRDFINIDCMDGMNKYPDNYFGLAIVDPPYGIDICSNNNGAGGALRHTKTATQNSQKKNETRRSQARWYKSGGGCV